MPEVKSPYNFVPLNETVVFPEWAQAANHDAPFANALSGKIKLKITANTPIFVRGQEIDSPDEHGKYFDFFKLNNQYAIPGTSIKGEIANVLEIMTFSKLRQINDNKYSIRDFQNENIYDKSLFAGVFGGWLTKAQDGFIIHHTEDAPGRISHEEIDKKFKKDFAGKFGRYYDARNKKLKNAKYKYELLGKLDQSRIELNFSKIKEEYGKLICKIAENNGKKGYLVMTGQPSQRIGNGTKKDGKFYEFVFWEPNKNEKPITVSPEVMKNFEFAMFNHEKESKQSDDWKFWKKKLYTGESIPVFYMLSDDNEVLDLGLSMLYKLPFKNSVKQMVNKVHFDAKPDFTETLFGHTEKEQVANAKKLKGRVSVETALIQNKVTQLPVRTLILGTPQASYYPFYLKQNITNGKVEKYITYNNDPDDEESLIAGRKRFPASNRIVEIKNQAKTDFTTTFKPLDKGSEFETYIHFHNLLPVEMGALLSAINFHKTSSCKHQLGMAKPYGYGNVDITIDCDKSQVNEYFLSKEKITEYLRIFENYMNSEVPNWIDSEQLTELITIATPIEELYNQLLSKRLNKGEGMNDFIARISYMILQDFVGIKHKSNQKALPKYSNFVGISQHPKALVTPQSVAKIERTVLSTESITQRKTDLLKKCIL